MRGARRAVTRRRVVPALAALAVVVVAAVSVGVEFANVLRTTSTLAGPVLDRQYHVNLAQFTCLQDQIRSDVPQGATVYTGGPGSVNDAALTEYATPWATPTLDPTAPWVLSLSSGPCLGLGIVAHRR